MQPQSQQKRQLRKSCNFCATQKIKCDGYSPCANCAHRSIVCQYSERGSSHKQKQARKGPGEHEEAFLPAIHTAAYTRTTSENPESASATSHARPARTGHDGSIVRERKPSLGMQVPTAVTPEFGSAESQCIQTFLHVLNRTIPFVSPSDVRPDIVHSGTLTAKHSLCWSAAALGAVLLGDTRAAMYAQCARHTLEHCRGQSTSLTARAHLLFATLGQFVDIEALCGRGEATPHAHFATAEAIFEAIQDSENKADEELAACLTHTRVGFVLSGAHTSALVQRLSFPGEAHRALLPFGLQALHYVDVWLLHLYRWCTDSEYSARLLHDSKLEESYHKAFLQALEQRDGLQQRPALYMCAAWFLAHNCFEQGKTQDGLRLVTLIAEFVLRWPVVVIGFLWHIVHSAALALLLLGQQPLAYRLESLLGKSAHLYMRLGREPFRLADRAHPNTVHFARLAAECAHLQVSVAPLDKPYTPWVSAPCAADAELSALPPPDFFARYGLLSLSEEEEWRAVNEVLEQSDPFLLLDRHVREHVIAQNFPPTQIEPHTFSSACSFQTDIYPFAHLTASDTRNNATFGFEAGAGSQPSLPNNDEEHSTMVQDSCERFDGKRATSEVSATCVQQPVASTTEVTLQT